MAAIPVYSDPTLAALDAVLESAERDNPRPYLGASQIGHPCSRSLWYSFRWTLRRGIPASGLRRIQDGHRSEQVLIGWLRRIPGVQLWVDDPEEPGQQIGIVDCAGHFRGHLDGIIQGLKQAPVTPHVWEAKACNEKKVALLRKLILEKGEKNALELWDEIYFAQAQVYMRGLELTRHYITVATPGCRDIVACRTDYQPKVAESLIRKAEAIITAERPPLKINEDSAWWQCKLCDAHPVCHGTALPEVNCRTCAHSTATLKGNAEWLCELHKKPLNVATQRAACDAHVYHPDLLANIAKPIAANNQTGSITFRRNDGVVIEIGRGAVSSRRLLAESNPIPAQEPDDVLEELAIGSEIPAENLIAGRVTEEQWPQISAAVSAFWSRWQHDEPRLARLRNLLDVIDGTYLKLMDQRAA